MTFLTRAATTALTGLAVLGFASAALAQDQRPIIQDSPHNNHVLLSEVIKSVGIGFYINPGACDDVEAFGWYSGKRKHLVICQENRTSTPEEQVEWTAEDYDTLRHEAQHMIQDCMDRKIDGELEPVYRNPIDLAIRVLGPDNMKKIHHNYSNRGASLHTVITEYEAFSVARLNDPLEQVEDIKRFCGGLQ